MPKDIFDKIELKDMFDTVKLDLMDEVELPVEDKVIYSDDMAQLVREQVQKELAKLPIAEMIASFIERNAAKKKEPEAKTLDKTKAEINRTIEEFKKDHEDFKKKTSDKYVDLRNIILSSGGEKLYLGGPAAMTIRDQDGLVLGYPQALKFPARSLINNGDGSFSYSNPIGMSTGLLLAITWS